MTGHSEIFDSIRDDLARVEVKLREYPRLEYEVVTAATEHLLSSGGKRIRPALVILSSRLYSDEVAAEVVSLAAAVEMLHTASLVHDDLIDGALLRRGIPTLNAAWTPGATILTGDYLFARAADLAAQAGDLRVMRIFADTLMTICAGELKQQFSDLEMRTQREDYYARIYAKTASLISLATEAAGVLARAPEEQVSALHEYGRNLGLAFQIVDDVLDFIGDEARMGKPVGSDLRQGLVTLPTLCYLERHPGDELVLRILCHERGGDQDIQQAVDTIRASGAIEAALGEAQSLARRSISALAQLPDGPARQSMESLTDFVVQRRA